MSLRDPARRYPCVMRQGAGRPNRPRLGPRCLSPRGFGRSRPQTVVFIHQYNTTWQFSAPAPKNQIDVLFARPQCITPETHSSEPRIDQAVSESLRCGHSSREHVIAPGGAIEFLLADRLLGPLDWIKRVENRIGIHLVRTKNQRLHPPTDRADFSHRSRQGKGHVDGSKAYAVESSSPATRAFAGQRRPRPARIVGPVDNRLKMHLSREGSGVAAIQNLIQIGVHHVGLSVSHELAWGHAGKAGQRLGSEPGIGHQFRS